MDYEQFTKPTLIEPGVKYFLNQTLKQCHVIKNNFHNFVFNMGLFIVFLLVLGFILIYKYKGRLTQYEKDKKNKEKQQYILSKIKMVQESKRQAHQELITGLPNWESHLEPINTGIIL
jgi:p-aminobenzoyl-glutamate transporter AbgT